LAIQLENLSPKSGYALAGLARLPECDKKAIVAAILKRQKDFYIERFS